MPVMANQGESSFRCVNNAMFTLKNVTP